jgi:peptidoglycan/LPS O-acetylase OafA/YrhL
MTAETSMESPKTKAIHGIDILRFLSALIVMLFHIGFWIGVPTSTGGRVTGGIFIFPWAAGTLSLGKMGVQTFFVISGFVIAYTAQNATIGSFLRSRILRLVPAVWICGTITLGLALAIHDRTPEILWQAWARSVLFFPLGEHIDGPYWTLPIECSFYLLVLVLIALKAIDWLEWVFLAVAATGLGFCTWIFFVHPELNGLSWNPWTQITLLVNGAEFAVGIFLWAILFKGLSTLRIAGLAIGLSAGAMEVNNWMVLPQDHALGVALWILSIIAIIVSVRYNEWIVLRLSPRGRAIIRQVGLLTYPLYLLHELAGSALMAGLASLGVPHVACLGIAVVTMITVALVIARYGETWLRKWLFVPTLNGLGGAFNQQMPQR